MLRELLPAGLLALASLPAPSSATLLYVASYAGSITTLNLTVGGGAADVVADLDVCRDLDDAGSVADNAAKASLVAVSSTDECGGSPAWLTVDHPNAMMYCSDEGLTTNHGSIAAFSTPDDGVLELVGRLNTPQGPVSAVLFGKGRLAVAHYAGSMLNVLDISDPAALSPVQNETFTMEEPGPVKYRQDAPHPHQTVIDPTGKFILTPDLGADLIRIFAVAADGLSIEVLEPFHVASGSGPRHITFAESGDKTFMYLIQELANTITGYELDYTDGLAFTEMFVIPTHGDGQEVPEGASAAEILVSPDNRFLTISSRNEAAFNIPSFDPSNSTDIPSDTLITYTIDAETGTLELLEKTPSGGRGPRQFIFNKAGDMVAVGLQLDSRVVIIQRDVETGKMGDILASATVEGDVTGVWFDE